MLCSSLYVFLSLDTFDYVHSFVDIYIDVTELLLHISSFLIVESTRARFFYYDLHFHRATQRASERVLCRRLRMS